MIRTGSRKQRTFFRYSLAVVAVAAATASTLTVLHVLGPRPNPIIFFSYVAAVLIPAWWGGYGPGLLATVLSHFVSPYFIIPDFNPTKVEVTRVVLTFGLALGVSYVAARRRHYEAALQAANDELERRVEERTSALLQANSELQALTDELRRANERLRRSNDDLERFAYIASHDLQEPLRIVGAYTEMLAKRYGSKLDGDAGQILNYILTGSQRMRELVNAILEFSQSSREAPNALPVDTNHALAVAKANLAPAIAEQGATLESGDLPVVHCDGAQIARVFQNLIGNALKYRSALSPVIKVAALREGDEWVFSVKDNGIGFAPEYAKMIFDLFKRLHPWAKVPGAGIGLAICKRIVEHHGGRIWVESAEGIGSTFYFSLPAEVRLDVLEAHALVNRAEMRSS